MSILKHLIHQPFVFATGLAALVHSTWSLGTLFSGIQPEAHVSIEFIGWIVPAFLIAFALDVGQIVTSAEIRGGERTRMKYATFAVFAVATYYLQWLYIAHHMPEMALAKGVRETWSGFATVLRDAAIWIIPVLLPLSTLLYTFSGANQPDDQEQPRTVVNIKPVEVQSPAPLAQLAMPLQDDSHVAGCPACGWKKSYDNADSARRGLATHQSKHCTAMHPTEGVRNGYHAE